MTRVGSIDTPTINVRRLNMPNDGAVALIRATSGRGSADTVEKYVSRDEAPDLANALKDAAEQ